MAVPADNVLMGFGGHKTPAEQYLFFSDIHLTEAEDHDTVWKNFKKPEHHADNDLIQRIRSFRKVETQYRKHLVLNGDNFDFRMVISRPDGRQDPDGLRPTGRNSSWKLEQILREHVPFCSELARFCEQHTLHIIPGNHDLEFNLTQVRRTLRRFLYNLSSQSMPARQFYRNIRFYQNHLYVPGFFYAEHGHHYDPFCALPEYRTLKKGELLLPFGDYSSIYLTNRMGHFNPFHTESYLLTTSEYLKIFLRYNFWRMFTRHNLFANWFVGSLRTLWRALRTGSFLRRRKFRTTSDSEMTVDKKEQIRSLYPHNIYFQPGLVIRTLWLDRIALGFVFAAYTASLLFTPWSLIGMGPLALAVWLYYHNKNKSDAVGGPHEVDLHGLADKLSSITDTPYVVMGHTHQPQSIKLSTGSYFFDLGTWSPYFKDVECREQRFHKRRSLVLTRDKNGIRHQFDDWENWLAASVDSQIA
jgi:UDP-2,3-diacylglucosamine pyrophosphatase LpxH